MSDEEVDRAYELYQWDDGMTLTFIANVSSTDYPHLAVETYASLNEVRPGTYWLVEHKSYGSSVYEFVVRAETRYVVDRVERPAIREALEA